MVSTPGDSLAPGFGAEFSPEAPGSMTKNHLTNPGTESFRDRSWYETEEKYEGTGIKVRM